MNKKMLMLIVVALMVLLPIVSSCGRTAPTGVTTVPGPAIPHPVNVLFANCNVCHVADQMSANVPLPHTGLGYTNADCISPACHEVAGATTTTPPTSTTTPPTSNTGTATGTSTGTSTGTETTTTTGTSGAFPTLTASAVPITSHSLAALAAYKAVGCLFCHGPNGSNPQPYAGTWNATAAGSVHFSGTFTIVPGSPQDHTGYTEATDCEQAGCHAAPTS